MRLSTRSNGGRGGERLRRIAVLDRLRRVGGAAGHGEMADSRDTGVLRDVALQAGELGIAFCSAAEVGGGGSLQQRRILTQALD